MAISSTLCGAILVENGQRLHESGAFVNQQWLWFNIALMAAAILGGQLVGLIAQPLNYYLKEVHGWTAFQVTAFLTVFNLPWIIKPVYGLISDFLPLFGYRRKS